MKSKLIILSAVVLIFSASQVFAGGGHDHGDHGEEAVVEKKGSMMEHKGSMMKEENAETINVGNKICPVSGEKVGGDMGDPVKFEYKGKIYNLCCTMCAKDFKKDPEKYIKIVEEEMKLYEEDHADHDESSEEGHEHMKKDGDHHDHDH